jgi:hypothetical protein
MADASAARVYEIQALIGEAVTADDPADDTEAQHRATVGLAHLLASYEQRIAELEAKLASK